MADTNMRKSKKIKCKLCNVFCTSALSFSEHVMGNRHRRHFQRVYPEKMSQLHKLQYFLDTYVPQEPLVGLEFVEEVEMKTGYFYKCALCGFNSERRPFFLHITGEGHIAYYLARHAPQFSVHRAMFLVKTLYVEALQQAAEQYCKIHGRKKIKESKWSDDNNRDLNMEKEVKTLPDRKTATDADENRALHTEPHPNPENKDDQCCEPPSEFTDNGDFLDYLGKFEIRNNEDAGVLKRILENCTQAVKRFCAEQAPQNQPWEELPGNPQGVADEADKDSSAVNSGSSVGQVAPAPVPETDALQLFYSSIKNMEESEVVGILHSIAATNPAFRGLSVPNTVQYLQATGRLKSS